MGSYPPDDHLGAYETGLDPEQSIWEHYNDMAATVDSIREREWGELADAILLFVGRTTEAGLDH